MVGARSGVPADASGYPLLVDAIGRVTSHENVDLIIGENWLRVLEDVQGRRSHEGHELGRDERHRQGLRERGPAAEARTMARGTEFGRAWWWVLPGARPPSSPRTHRVDNDSYGTVSARQQARWERSSDPKATCAIFPARLFRCCAPSSSEKRRVILAPRWRSCTAIIGDM